MQKYISAKPDTTHLYCGSPIMLDKSLQWGEGSIQRHDYGCFIQMDENGRVAHLVAADENHNTPVGWEPTSMEFLFRKLPIFAEQTIQPVVSLTTKDGPMTYENHEGNGWICYNTKGGDPDRSDHWFVPNAKFLVLYKLPD